MIERPVVNFKQDSHCSYCGSRFSEQIKWPRNCFICNNESYKNPIPVVVVLIPVLSGLLIQQRGIMPGKNEWAVSSGYLNDKETYQQAAAREMKEEIYLDSEADDYELFDVCSSSTGTLLIFAVYKKYLSSIEELNFVPNEEVLDIKAIFAPEELAFPTHTEMVKRYFNYVDK